MVEGNAPGDIHAAVNEMFDRLEGNIVYGSEELKLQKRAEHIYETHAAYGMASISRHFLKSHQSLLK